MDPRLCEIISPAFYGVHGDIRNGRHTHYWLKGGRGSTKSSFISVEIVLSLMRDPLANAVVLRKYANNLRESVFAQLLWAIDILGVSAFWRASVSPMQLTYVTGQSIRFLGLDDPQKIKSLKFRHGYPKVVWFEELPQFNNMEEIRNVLQSLMRGGDEFLVFNSYNPPASQNNWVNEEVSTERGDRLVHHSDYRSVPQSWLGEQFIVEAEHVREKQPTIYEHEYLGAVTGTGAEVFHNVRIAAIADEDIENFDYLYRGVDFGYATDPLVYHEMAYDRKRRRLFIFREFCKVGCGNRQAVEEIRKCNPANRLVIADSAEPRTIAEFKNLGLHIRGAKKGPDSVRHGVKFLQDLEEIVIDRNRCPNAAHEFLTYELDRDARGELKADFPDKNNHSIDAVRYALNDVIKGPSISF